jgi:hypothetical protein
MLMNSDIVLLEIVEKFQFCLKSDDSIRENLFLRDYQA